MKTKYFIFAAAALALAACSSDETVSDNSTSPGNEISFRPLVSNVTRATDITADNLSSFTVFATEGNDFSKIYFNETAFTNNSGTYTSATKYYWPSSGTLDFYAYAYNGADGQVTHTAQTKAFTVTPAAVAANQTDLVFANTNGKSKDGTYNTDKKYGADGVPLNFRHAESKVTIKLKNSSTTTTITVGNVALGNVYTTGTYTFTGSTDNDATTPSNVGNTDGNNNNTYLRYGDWSNQTTSGSYIQAAATTSYTSATEATALTNSMILIPQTLTNPNAYASSSQNAAYGGAYITVELKIQNTTNNAYIVGDGESPVTALWPLPATKWLPGYHYIYTVDLAGGGYYPTNREDTDENLDPILEGAEIKFVSVTVDDWNPAE